MRCDVALMRTDVSYRDSDGASATVTVGDRDDQLVDTERVPDATAAMNLVDSPGSSADARATAGLESTLEIRCS